MRDVDRKREDRKKDTSAGVAIRLREKKTPDIIRGLGDLKEGINGVQKDPLVQKKTQDGKGGPRVLFWKKGRCERKAL